MQYLVIGNVVSFSAAGFAARGLEVLGVNRLAARDACAPRYGSVLYVVA